MYKRQVLEAEYEPWVTVLTSDETGENTEQPLALAEGVFTENDKITAQYTQVDKLPSGSSGGDNAKVISVSIESGTIDKTTKIRLLKGCLLYTSGVDVEYHIFPGCYHSFEIAVPESHYAKTAYGLMYSALKRAFKIDI